MAKPTIEVMIDEDGQATITVRGVVGKQCEELTEDLEAELGTKTSRHRTPDYYRQAQSQSQKQEQR